MAGVITVEDAVAAQDVHFAVDALNRALETAHNRGLRIVLDCESQGEPVNYAAMGQAPFWVRGEPPSIRIEVSLPLPADSTPPESRP